MYDATIIGGGLGGLVCGALLSKQGYKVKLLEQHTIVGGAATCFTRKGIRCEVGLHEMDDPYGAGKKELFDALDVYNHVTFVRVPEFFRVLLGDSEVVLPDGVAEVMAVLKQRYPNDAAKIDRYFRTLAEIRCELIDLAGKKWYKLLLFPLFYPQVMRHYKKSAADLTRDMDPELALLLHGNVGYYADRASHLSALFHAMAQGSFYDGGGWFIQGGSQTLSDYLASVITGHGGEIVTSARVQQVTMEGKKAAGVTYVRRKEHVEVRSRIVIADIAPYTVYTQMLPPAARDSKILGREVADSLLTIYVGFSKNLKEVYGTRPYSNFFFEGCDSLAAYDAKVDGPTEARNFVFVDYSQIDAALAPEGRSFGAICTTDFLRDWEGLDKERYAQQKAAVAEAFLARLERAYPGIRELILFYEVGTAKTMQRYLQSPGGTAYGYAPTPQQVSRRVPAVSRTVPNLFFTGSWVMGGGFTPSILSGQMSAEAAVKVLDA